MGIFNHLFCVDINRGVRNFQDTPGAVLLDVRAPQLYARRHIPGSRNLPFAQLDRVGDLLPDHDVPLFVCAHGGETSAKATDRLKAMGLRAKMDASDQSMGWKAAEYEMKGIPLRVEIGPKDMEKNQCVLVRRDNGEKVFVSLDKLETAVPAALDAIHDGLYQKAKKNLEEHIFQANSLEEAKALQVQHGGFIKTMWCGDEACEIKMKEEGGMTSRCVPFAQEHLGDTCPICGRAAKKMIYWGVAY